MKSKSIKAVITILALIMLSALVAVPSEVQAASGLKIKLNKKNIVIYKGKSVQLKAKVTAGKGNDKMVEWRSSDPKIASVSSSGKVKARKSGTVVVTAASKADKKVSASCTVRVRIDDSSRVDCVMCLCPPRMDVAIDKSIRNIRQRDKLLEMLEKEKNSLNYSEYRYDILIEELGSYDEEFFEDHVLYLRSFIIGDSRGIKKDRVERIRKSNGKYKMLIALTDYKEHAAYLTVMRRLVVFAGVTKQYAETINQVEVEFKSQNDGIPYFFQTTGIKG